jgi:long-chain acyl-CoA synthetase
VVLAESTVWPKNVPKHINYPDVALHVLLEANAKKNAKSAAVVFGQQTLSYKELDQQANRFANALLQMGVKRGDCVALFLPNVPQFVVAFFGVLRAGAVVTSISPHYRQREVAQQLLDSGAQVTVTLDTLYPVIADVREKTRQKHVLITKIGEVEDFLEEASAEKPPVEVCGDDLAVLQYTGGTTGTPKAAMLTHRNLVSNAYAFAAATVGKRSDVFLSVLPLFHIYGLTTSLTVPISLGAKMVLQPKFETAATLELIQRYRVSVFCGVPTMYSALVANPDLAKYDLTSLRVCISGASSLPPAVQKRFMEVTGGVLAEGYGLTEASPVTHCTPVDKQRLKVGSIGLPLPDTEARIVDLETTEPLRQGEVGELAVRGPQVMKGYWRSAAETALVLCNGWLLTGDIARMDAEGYFYIVDRKKDLIKTNDYSVYPRELEDLLYEHPAVKLCAVVGKTDRLAGEVPKAFVVLKEGFSASAEGLMRFVNPKIASYKALREVEFRSELPLSSAGKVLRRQLKVPKNG